MGTPNRSQSRVTINLPAHVAADLTAVASRMGISQSALLADLVAEPIAAMRAIADELPQAPTPDQVMRARGKSVKLLHGAIRSALDVADSEWKP